MWVVVGTDHCGNIPVGMHQRSRNSWDLRYSLHSACINFSPANGFILLMLFHKRPIRRLKTMNTGSQKPTAETWGMQKKIPDCGSLTSVLNMNKDPSHETRYMNDETTLYISVGKFLLQHVITVNAKVGMFPQRYASFIYLVLWLFYCLDL